MNPSTTEVAVPREAIFKRPLYSFMGDWVMYKDIWTGKIPL